MLRYHMAVLTRDNALKREVKRVTTATGSTADFIGDPSGFNPQKPADLAIFDARTGDPDKAFFDKVPAGAKIQYVLKGDTLIDRLHYLKEDRVTSLLCHDARFDDDEFIASATKALRGDVFGLQKYFPWGVTSFTMQVNSYEQKTRAIDVLMRYAKLAGVRGPVRDRIQLVCDELMMNALYHAPVDEKGDEKYAGRSLKELAQLEHISPIQVQYGCSGRYFGVSVRDAGGSLTRKKALEYLLRAKSGAAHIESKAGGAGLGLISVLRSVSKLVFNLDPGYSTEVIAIFDMDLFAKGQVGARSLHVFTQASEPEDEAEADGEESEESAAGTNATPATGGSNNGKWMIAALLLAVLSALATAYVMRRGAEGPARATAATLPNPAVPTITVIVSPGDAVPRITMNGERISAGQPATVTGSGKSVQIRVESDRYKPHTEILDASTLGDRNRIHVNLLPKGGGSR
jgi:hypothetical protein